MTDPRELKVVESITGQWFYHLSPNRRGPALCGYANTMVTHCTLDSWGFRGHLREKYCEKCEKLARKKGFLR